MTNSEFMMKLTIMDREKSARPRKNNMRAVVALIALAFLSSCAGPRPAPNTVFERAHPKPSLFETTLPWKGYALPLPPI